MKKTLALIIVTAVLLASFCACGSGGAESSKTPSENQSGSQTTSGESPSGGSEELPADAPEHEQLFAYVRQLMRAAEEQGNAGQTLTEEYLYGLAQAEISSLRQCVDTVLWLKGEGENLAEVIGSAPYKGWDAIVGAGPGSDAPVYFEGLLLTFQGKKDEAEKLYDSVANNPRHRERDLYYLRNLSIEELYAVKEKAAELENEVYDIFVPRTRLIEGRTGAEFLPEYHLILAESYSEERPSDAYQCAVNALLVNPADPVLYSAAAFYAMEAKEPEAAVEYVNEGLFSFPEDSSLNYMAALLCAAAGDTDQAREYLATAEKGSDEDLSERIDALYEQIGGR